MRSILSPQATLDIARISEPLIAAIEQYNKDRGEYPSSLSELIPRYLPKIPDTGYGKRRQFHYYRAEARLSQSDFLHRWLGEGEAGYSLVVEKVPVGTLVFRPTLRYEDLRGRMIPGTTWCLSPID
jgi:hypothetical protein